APASALQSPPRHFTSPPMPTSTLTWVAQSVMSAALTYWPLQKSAPVGNWQSAVHPPESSAVHEASHWMLCSTVHTASHFRWHLVWQSMLPDENVHEPLQCVLHEPSHSA